MDVNGGSIRTYNHYTQPETIGSNCAIYFDFANDGNAYKVMSILVSGTQPTLNITYTSSTATIEFIAPGTLADAKSPPANWYVLKLISGDPIGDDTFIGTDGSIIVYNNYEIGAAFRDMAEEGRWFHFHGSVDTMPPGVGYRIGKDADSGDFPSFTTDKIVMIVVAKTDSNVANKKSTLFGIGDCSASFNSGKFIGVGPAWAIWGTGGSGAGNTIDDSASVSASTDYSFALVKDGTTVKHYRDGVLIDGSATAAGYEDLDADPTVFFNFDNSNVWGDDHTEITWYGAVVYSVTTVPEDHEINSAMLWCKEKWIAGENVLYPGFINK